MKKKDINHKEQVKKSGNAALLKEAVEFFQKEPGFKRLFHLFNKNYYRLGRMGGTVKLLNLKPEEKDALSGIMGRDYSRQDSASISLAAFKKALKKTRFAGVELKELLEGYHGKSITTRTEEKNRILLEKSAFFQSFYREFSSENCRLWLEHIQQKGAGTRGIHSAYEQAPKLLQKQLTNVLKAVEELASFYQLGDSQRCEENTKYERLPVFASRITGDPHGFDLNTEQGRFLISALQFICSRESEPKQKRRSLSAEEVTELLGRFGLIRDDLLNFVTCTGLLAFRGEEKEPVSMWQNAWKDGMVLNVPLREITRINRLEPAVCSSLEESRLICEKNFTCNSGDAFSIKDNELKVKINKKVVFVVENSGVFSGLLDKFPGALPPPVVCSHGQFKLAAFLLFDRLVKGGNVIYYSGDFDPEGLQIAQRLLQRYPRLARLWRFTTADYESCISQVALSEARLHKLKGITLPALLPLKEKMQDVKKAGYQEQIVPLLIEDIKSFM
ncbi:TIGR02679 domain-containing protein [Candidatus Contubernalis alkaliaceticus]|uniref:TIGR02679 domain-containing protein n=1 Tax=Candidatus Contubernalis alkaliaceticus TaxID=338645 RepID=UPI001F4BE45A|nr:TIGR02679 domain-containing protein [Candidatus Contubernalis alkalaceticus]UNC91166.1 DUF2399 domain-containing protein [Candidatus Contubernalis alkalaceticus]